MDAGARPSTGVGLLEEGGERAWGTLCLARTALDALEAPLDEPVTANRRSAGGDGPSLPG
jgi:hypothetical protein